MLRTGSKYTDEEEREGQPGRVTGLESGEAVTASPNKKMSESLDSICF